MRDRDIVAAATWLRAAAHPTRLKILAELRKGTKCVNDISDLLDRPQPNVSQHLAALREHGLVGFYQRGVSRCYYLMDSARIGDLLEVATRSTPQSEARRTPLEVA